MRPAILMLLAAAGSLCAQPSGPEAVFDPGPDFIPAAVAKCHALIPPRPGPCFLAQMQEAGASTPALAFARLLIERTGMPGYLRAFRETGRVDIAYVQYAFRANELNGVYFINGTPALVDVDGGAIPGTATLESNPAFAALHRKYPNISLFPGDRFHTETPEVQALRGGGQRFTVAYRLNNLCHACEQVGTAFFGFDFDAAGHFLGARLLSVQAAERTRSRSSAGRSHPARVAPAS